MSACLDLLGGWGAWAWPAEAPGSSLLAHSLGIGPRGQLSHQGSEALRLCLSSHPSLALVTTSARWYHVFLHLETLQNSTSNIPSFWTPPNFSPKPDRSSSSPPSPGVRLPCWGHCALCRSPLQPLPQYSFPGHFSSRPLQSSPRHITRVKMESPG